MQPPLQHSQGFGFVPASPAGSSPWHGMADSAAAGSAFAAKCEAAQAMDEVCASSAKPVNTAIQERFMAPSLTLLRWRYITGRRQFTTEKVLFHLAGQELAGGRVRQGEL